MTIKEALNDGTLSLEDNIDYADMTEEEYKQEIERLNNIIKEVGEYIEEKINIAEQQFVSIPNKVVDIEVLNKLLEILDKGE